MSWHKAPVDAASGSTSTPQTTPVLPMKSLKTKKSAKTGTTVKDSSRKKAKARSSSKIAKKLNMSGLQTPVSSSKSASVVSQQPPASIQAAPLQPPTPSPQVSGSAAVTTQAVHESVPVIPAAVKIEIVEPPQAVSNAGDVAGQAVVQDTTSGTVKWCIFSLP